MTTDRNLRALDRSLTHFLENELFHKTSPEAKGALMRVGPLGLRNALSALRDKEVEAILAGLGPSTTPDDKYATLFWIEGPMQEKLQLTTGVVEADHFKDSRASTYYL